MHQIKYTTTHCCQEYLCVHAGSVASGIVLHCAQLLLKPERYVDRLDTDTAVCKGTKRREVLGR